MENESTYTVLNPRGIQPGVKITPLNPRAANLSGKVVYAVSQRVAGADTFQKKVVEHLAEYAPGVKAVYMDKPKVMMDDDPELVEKVTANADAAIYATAG